VQDRFDHAALQLGSNLASGVGIAVFSFYLKIPTVLRASSTARIQHDFSLLGTREFRGGAGLDDDKMVSLIST